MRLGRALVAAVAVALVAALPAAASGWYPHTADATWTYEWSDSAYQTTPSIERVSVLKSEGPTFTLAWKVDGGPNTNGCEIGKDYTGWVQLLDTNSGIVNGPDGWCGSLPPAQFPVLCPTASRCGNTITSALYTLLWGSRAPVLLEPLLRGAAWASTGGVDNTVSGTNEYAGTETISVPAFPAPVVAAKVRSEITQAGALGDPYGSGLRTVWWVYGVGPVKIVFQHAGGAGAPVTTATLKETNLVAQPPPSDIDWFPLDAGKSGTFRWTNRKHFKKPVVEKYTVDQAANGTAILKVSSVSGPIKVAGAYQFTRRLDGITSVASATKAASLAKLPPLGPSSLPAAKRRHFFTPFDLMTFGFNPLLPAYAKVGDTWRSDPNGRDYSVYGVDGTTTVVGTQRVTVPAGSYTALVVRSTLTQRGFPFGSGIRTMWFAPGKGLVKLRFAHGDGSTSVVERLK